MIQPPILYNKGTQTYYLKEDEECETCRKLIEGAGILKIFYGKRLTKWLLLCPNCVYTDAVGIFYAKEGIHFITEKPPLSSVPYLITPPELTPGRLDTFSAASLPSERTTDRTRYAGRESIEGATVGDKSYITHDKKEFKELDRDEIDSFFIDYKKQKPVVPKVLK